MSARVKAARQLRAGTPGALRVILPMLNLVPDGMGGERIEKRKLMNISISCDHRVVDGWDAASFIQAVKRLIESPALLLVN